MKSWKKPTDKLLDKALGSVIKETDRQYFFFRLKSPLWIRPLSERGYFETPPSAKKLPDGYINFPNWPELEYLKNVCKDAPREVIAIVLQLPITDNPRVYDYILEIALLLPGHQSVQLKPKILEYTKLDYQYFSHKFSDVLAYWTSEGQLEAALALSSLLVKFRPDPRTKEKQTLRKKNPESYSTLLQPSPPFDDWNYREILKKGIIPLADREPYQVACILIDATSNATSLGFHLDTIEKSAGNDYSDIWCRRLGETSEDDYQDTKNHLIHALTYACEKVYEGSPESIIALDELLRRQMWYVFERIRQHLYVLNLTEQTKPWIREFIISHQDYSKWDHRYEFQRMVRLACEHFGTELLSEGELEEICEAIHSGPSKENFREWMGEKFTEEKFIQRQKYFHRAQFKPFASVLLDNYADYFRELGDIEKKEITDDDYGLGEMRSGTVSLRSPKPKEELQKLNDEEILTFINEWQDSYRLDEEDFVEVNINALSRTFQTVFKESIITDNARLHFWMKNRDRMERPVYVRSMVLAIQDHLKDKNFDQLDVWFDLCNWVLSHPDQSQMEGDELNDESREKPSWRSSRRAVRDFVGFCLGAEINVPISWRNNLTELLETLCTQFDSRLDENIRVLTDREDQLTEAINNTRSLALEDLIDFGRWVKKLDKNADISEVTRILEDRFRSDSTCPLTLPEYAILGMHFGGIVHLNKDWATEHKEDIFPQSNWNQWLEAFDNFTRYHRPFTESFDILKDDIEFALGNLDRLTRKSDSGKDLVDSLAQHLFTYYLWEKFPLDGSDSLLKIFYEKTDGDRKRWATLFDHVGHILNNSRNGIESVLKDRIRDFFDWRFKVGEESEIREFTFWLSAKCLEGNWRLNAYSQILDLCGAQDVGISIQLDALKDMLLDHTSMVLECFAKLYQTRS